MHRFVSALVAVHILTAYLPADEVTVVATIEKVGGQVQRDDKLPGKPVTGVGLGNITDADAVLMQVKELRQLHSIMLYKVGLTIAGLMELKDVKQLQTLIFISSCPVTDTGLREIMQIKQLTWLSLTDTKVTDAGFKELEGLDQLQCLDLGNTKVTDAGLNDIKNFKHLTSLSIEATPITDAGLSELKDLCETGCCQMKYL